MISSKYFTSIIVLATLALIPVTIHTYMGITLKDNKSTGNINRKLLNLYSQPTDRKPEKVRKAFDSKDWIERNYIAGSGQKIMLFVARSFDYKRLYHHPEIALVGSLNVSQRELKKIRELNNLPVHMIFNKEGNKRGIIAYSLLIGEELVGNPYKFQLLNSWKSLFQYKKAMTLFLVYDPSFSPDTPPQKSMAVRLLNEAIKDFQAL